MDKVFLPFPHKIRDDHVKDCEGCRDKEEDPGSDGEHDCYCVCLSFILVACCLLLVTCCLLLQRERVESCVALRSAGFVCLEQRNTTVYMHC